MFPGLQQYMGPHLAVVDDIPEPTESVPHPIHGTQAEDIGGQPIEWEVAGQPTEGAAGAVAVG